MPQVQLPIFPDGVTYITNHLATSSVVRRHSTLRA
jgi:hypothetical protein